MKSLAVALFQHDAIETTVAKATITNPIPDLIIAAFNFPNDFVVNKIDFANVFWTFVAKLVAVVFFTNAPVSEIVAFLFTTKDVVKASFEKV